MSILPGNIDSPLKLHGHYFTQKCAFLILLHRLISGANCFILQFPMLSLGFFTLNVYIIARGETEGNRVNVEGK